VCVCVCGCGCGEGAQHNTTKCGVAYPSEAQAQEAGRWCISSTAYLDHARRTPPPPPSPSPWGRRQTEPLGLLRSLTAPHRLISPRNESFISASPLLKVPFCCFVVKALLLFILLICMGPLSREKLFALFVFVLFLWGFIDALLWALFV
jgi:hypothetical protein